jgi:hypothetical protein
MLPVGEGSHRGDRCPPHIRVLCELSQAPLQTDWEADLNEENISDTDGNDGHSGGLFQ